MTKLINFKIIEGEEGSLVALESLKNVPFDIKRVYYIFNNKKNIKRGHHAHIKLKQLAVCVSGSCKFLLDYGKNKEIVELNNPGEGLFIDHMIWREMFDFSSDCVLMVLADSFYDEKDYIRNYEEFLKGVK